MPPRRKYKKYCKNCELELVMKNGKYNKIFCSSKCRIKFCKGNNHSCWKGGQYKDASGYVYIWSQSHPFKTKLGYVKRSRLEVEKYLGRFLNKGEIVHHKNRIKHDDSLENLEILTSSEHTKLHQREDELYKSIAIKKFENYKILPDVIEKGKIVSILPEHRTYVGQECFLCKKLFWARKDYGAVFCSSKCSTKHGWEEGKYIGRKPRCKK